MKKFISLIALCIVCFYTNLKATGFDIIPYQGTIADASGQPYTGNYDFSFEIKNSAGTSLWSSGVVNLPVNLGAYSVSLGEAPLSSVPDTIWKLQDTLYLEISFNDGVSGMETLSPMVKFLPVPYSVRAKYADEFCGDSLHVDYINSTYSFNHVIFTDTLTANIP